jgi:hypothetical protein
VGGGVEASRWKEGPKGQRKPGGPGDEEMKLQRVLAMILTVCWFGTIPAVGHDWSRHDRDCAYGNHCNYNCDRNTQGNHRRCPWGPNGGATDLKTTEGKITEMIYLPGATPDGGMVEVRLQSAGQSELIRLAPVGFLKQSGLLLHEGDAITVKGFPISGMEGDILVATELHKGEKTVSLRDTFGRRAW